jgi:SAM-dependent methyltransferase
MSELRKEQLDEICERQLFYLPYFRGMLRAVEQSQYPQELLVEPILDIGAGDGHFTWAMLEGKVVDGIDPWLAPLEEAESWKIYRSLALANGQELPFESGQFPTAISNSVLEHIPGVEEVLNEVGRCLHAGGHFIFAVPNERFRTELWGMEVLRKVGLGFLTKHYSRFFNWVSRHVNLDAPEVWLERLRDAGFGEVKHWNYFPREALHQLERGHAANLPNLLWKKLFGKWVLFKSRKNPFIHFDRIRRLVGSPLDDNGCCTFYVATKDS